MLKPKVIAAVLASGYSRRLGPIDKMDLEVKGKKLIELALSAATNSKVAKTLLICPQDRELTWKNRYSGCEFIVNHQRKEGLSSSVKCATHFALLAQADALIIMLADMPLVESKHINRLIYEFVKSPDAIFCQPIYQGIKGNPILWNKSAFRKLLTLDGDKGARGLIKVLESDGRFVDINSDAIHFDIDTLEDLHALNSRLGAK